MINIVCVLRHGGKVGYDQSWVIKLKNSVTRHLTIPFNFICLSDCEVDCDSIPLDNIGEGYWAKLQLFKKDHFKGPTLYFDLDTLICNNIDRLVKNLLDQNNFVMWKDPDYNISSSAIMYWNGDYSFIYEEYLKNKNQFETKFSNGNLWRLIGDQAVISTTVSHKFVNDFCPKDWLHVVRKTDNVLDLSQARILIFRKAHTKPSNMPDHKLVKEHWK